MIRSILKRPRHLFLVLSFALAVPLAAMSSTGQAGWVSLPSLPDPIGFGGMFAGVLHGELVAGGGSQWDKPVWLNGNKRYNDKVWALSSPDGAWLELPVKLPTPRGHFSGATEPGVIYLAGGFDASGGLRDVLALREHNDGLAWAQLPDLPVPVGYGCAAVAGGRLYVIGGLDDPASLKPAAAVWSLDLVSPDAGWRRESDLPGPGVFVATAAGVGEHLYVFGGIAVDADGAYAPSSRASRLDTTTGKWQTLNEMPDARVGPITPCPVLPDGRLLLAGGYSTIIPGVQREHPGFNVRTYFYDPASDTWSAGPDVPHGPVPDRDASGDPGPAPMIGAPGVVWQNLAVAVSGEVRISTRSPQVLALPLPTEILTESK
jgi:N-acetylneuraminate epimerase